MSTASQVATHTAPADPAHPAHPAVGAATSLLDAYAPGDHFLATPGRT
ncbi:isochorismate synthase, partial [Streptomyces sp. MBT98]|nr:isochorismate synthase [Streptomyces sp. MBT98]